MTDTTMSTGPLVFLLLALAALAFGLLIGWLLATAQQAERWRRAMAEDSARYDKAASEDKRRIAELERAAAEQNAVKATLLPLQDSLEGLRRQVAEAEKARATAEEQLRGQLRHSAEQSLAVAKDVHVESRRLSQALTRSHIRGAWGEEHLTRLLETAGLVSGVHYVTQDSRNTDEGRLRPDVVVNLAGGRTIVIDSKVPLEHVLHGSVDENGDLTAEAVKAHAEALGKHIRDLGSKTYWRQYERSPEFVVLYIPAEGLLSIALQADPALQHTAHAKNVILATPNTLLALLRTVAYGWREEAVAANAAEVYGVAKELAERLSTMTDHFAKVGRGLGTAVDAFNKTVGAYEGRVLVSARRLSDLEVSGGKEIDLRQVESAPRVLRDAS